MAKRYFKNSTDVRRYLSEIIHRVETGTIEVGQANCIGQLCNFILKTFDLSEVDKRLEDLEKLATDLATKLTYESREKNS